VLEHHARMAGGLQRLRQDHVVEGVVRIVGQVGVGVALDHGEPLRHAFVDALARQLDAAPVDAAALAKMSERGQIEGGIVDGPLAMDNAMSLEAAQTKGIKSFVAGRAEVLIAPNLEAANMIVKQLTFVAHAEGGGLVLGASAPVILTSRADDERVRLGSCAVAALYWHWKNVGTAFAMAAE